MDETPRSTLLRGVPDRPFDGRAACGLLRATRPPNRLPFCPHRSPACGAPCPQRARAFDSSLDLRERGALDVSRAHWFPPRAQKRFTELAGVGIQRLKTPLNFYTSVRCRERSFTVLFPHRYSPTHVPPRPRDLRTSSNGFIGTKSCVGGLRDGRGVRLRWRSRRRRTSWRRIARARLSLPPLFHSAARDASTRLPAMYPQLTATSPAQLARVQPNARTSVMNSAVRIE